MASIPGGPDQSAAIFESSTDAVIGVTRGVESTQAAPHALDVAAELVGQHGDANCDGRIGAADFTASIERIPSGDPGACGADVVRDGFVTPADLPVLVRVVFES